MQYTIPWFPKKKDSENIVLLVLFRTTRITPHYPIRGSSPSNFCWMGCRRYSAASRHEVLLDENDFRSFWQALELGDVLLLLQLRVKISVLWNQFCAPLSDPPIRVSAYLFGLLQHVQVSTRNSWWIRVHIRVSAYLIIGFFGFGSIRWVSLLLPTISESKSHI